MPDSNDWGIRGSGIRGASALTPRPAEAEVPPRPSRRRLAETVAGGVNINRNRLLLALASDWSTMRARRAHDRRIDITIDGEHFSIYTV